MSENLEKSPSEKIKIYINLEPSDLKFGAIFSKTETFQSVINFVYNQTKKLSIKFSIGRINETTTNAIILPEFVIGEFLEPGAQITVYSKEFGFNFTNNPGDTLDKKFLYSKDISDLYKSNTFLKKKRKEEFNKSQSSIKKDDEESKVEKKKPEIKKDNKNNNKNKNKNNNKNNEKNNFEKKNLGNKNEKKNVENKNEKKDNNTSKKQKNEKKNTKVEKKEESDNEDSKENENEENDNKKTKNRKASDESDDESN